VGLLLEGQLPPELAVAMEDNLTLLLEQHPLATGFAVRSSAVMEDTSTGFAGQ
jgi:hypothetical protein